MARRNSYPNSKWFRQPGQAYARTSWPTRYYQRKVTGSVVAALAGLNTTVDDFSKKEGESPYLWNVRMNGSKEKRKRAQSMSRMGSQFFCMPEGLEEVFEPEAGDIKLAVRENHDIKWKVSAKGRTSKIGFKFHFDETPEEDNHAHFVVIIRDNEEKEICRVAKSVKELYNEWSVTPDKTHWFRLITTPQDDFIAQCTLVDDLDDKGNPNNFALYLNANGCANHLYADHELPNLDHALREKAYDWKKGVSVPTTALATVEAKPFPVWLQKGFFVHNNERWVTLGAIVGGKKKIFAQKYAEINQDSGEVTFIEQPTEPMREIIPEDKIDQRATQVRCTQAGKWLFFVDGYSNLQKIDLDTWEVMDARPNMDEVDTFKFTPNVYYFRSTIIIEDGHFQKCKQDFQAGDVFDQDDWERLDDGSSITAWPGASLIYFLNNRIFLSGFHQPTVGETEPKPEPNLVIMSSIDSVTPRYDMFNRSVEFFYVPDVASSQSSSSPVTAFGSIGDYLAIFTADGFVLESVSAAVEFAGISQTTPEGSQFGTMKQEHVCQGRNNIYFFNPTLGLMRTAGSTAETCSAPVDSEIVKMTDGHSENIVLGLFSDIAHIFYSEDDKPNSLDLLDYTSVAQHRSYWFRDNHRPVSSFYADEGYDVSIAAHSEYPCLYFLDKTLKDFDCAILYEYYTKYIPTPDRLDDLIVRRVYVTTLQTFNSSVYVGLDYDHNNNPIVWRKFITPVPKGEFASDDIFGDDNESGSTNLQMRILTSDTHSVQLRLKQYCYDFQAEILMLGFEYGSRKVL